MLLTLLARGSQVENQRLINGRLFLESFIMKSGKSDLKLLTLSLTRASYSHSLQQTSRTVVFSVLVLSSGQVPAPSLVSYLRMSLTLLPGPASMGICILLMIVIVHPPPNLLDHCHSSLESSHHSLLLSLFAFPRL